MLARDQATEIMAAAAYMGCTFSSALNRKAHYALLEAEDG